MLENPQSSKKSYFDSIMIGVIVLSVILLLYRVEHATTSLGGYFEQGILLIFIVEYLLRAWIYSDSHKIIIDDYEKSLYLNIPFKASHALRKVLLKKLEFAFSPFAIIDMLAILPSYRPLDILRGFIIFRLFKLFRYSNSVKVFAEVLASKRFELLTLLIFSCFLVFIASVSFYMFESQYAEKRIDSLFDAFYWSIVTLAAVGYGDVTPHTTSGKLVTMTLILTSLGVVSFFTSILVAAFNEKMDGLRESHTYAEVNRFKNFVIICGFGRVGQEVARQLSRDRQKFIIIDKNEQHIATANRLGYLTIHSDASRNEVLINAGIHNGASTILCTTGDDVVNVYITLTGRHLNKNIRIISRANRQENVNKLYQAGADNVILPFEIAGMLAAEFLGQPVAFEAISGILQNQTEIVMDTLLVTEHSPLDNTRIEQLELHDKKLTLLGVISANPIHLKHKNKYQVKQQHFYFNPSPQFILRHEDILVFFGRKYSIDHFRDQVEQRRLLNRKSQ